MGRGRRGGVTLSETGPGADSTLDNEQFIVDPRYHADDDAGVPAVWEQADRVRALLGQTSHDRRDRTDLEHAAARQLRTAVLYQNVARIVKENARPGRLTLYLLLFPGEGRDNTGLKDLNDNVLGYTLNQEFTARRQHEIQNIFHPNFTVVGQDFKTALFITWEQNRAEFDRRLHLLDKVLRQMLLDEFLPKSDKKDTKEARELAKALKKDPDYRFDVYYGTDSAEVGPKTTDVLLAIFLLLTQAMKGAAVARYVAKGRSLKIRAAKPFGRNAKPDRKFDPRGKEYGNGTFLTVARTSPAVKTFVLKPPQDHVGMLEYNVIYIDTVWTFAFFRNQFVGNPDVIRDVRKKRLVAPKFPNTKYTVKAQKELLELWIVVLNLVDLVKDFLQREFARELHSQHENAVRVLDNLRDPAKPVDVRQTEEFLTRDLRFRQLAVLGTASEFQFYAPAADHPSRIVFMMDVRDLGVDVLLMHDAALARILDGRMADRRLLEETVRATESVTEMRRSTYDHVVSVFGRYHALLKGSAAMRRTNGVKEAARAFRKASGSLGAFEDDVQIMLGGDEFMVAAHPRFAAYLHVIVAELSHTVLGPGPVGPDTRAGSKSLAIRAGVAFSQARTPGDRRQHQLAHHRAMRLADESHGLLKDLERRDRRIERLIEKLEDNPKKKDQAPPFRKRLADLRLTKLFTRVQHGNPRMLPMRRIEPLVQALREGRLPRQDGHLVELVDHQGKVVDHAQLVKTADAFEEVVRKKVGWDNVHVDTPPATKIPGGGGDDDDEP